MSYSRRRLPSAVLALALPALLMAQPAGNPPASAVAPISVSLAAAGPDVQNYQQHVSTLADPFFEGRAPGLRGNRLAAEYIEFHLNRLGLTPAFKDSEHGGGPSFRQPFTMGATLSVAERGASFASGGGPVQALMPLTDFTVHEYSASGEASGPVVFVGYSITDGQDGYSTYPPLDGSKDLLKGKIAMVLRFEPMKADGHSRWIEEGWSLNADLSGKLEGAAARGAAGVILVTPANAADPRAGEIRDAEGARSIGFSLDIPVVMMTPEAADRLVRAGDASHRSLADLQKLADDSGSVIDLPEVTASLKAKVDQTPIPTDNVGAILPGKGDLADQCIVIGAHYDHLGYGFGGPKELHPGADDNASGTSGVLLIAEMLKKDYAALPADASARSVLFLCFSGEESGLIGSRFYADHPTISADKMYLMLNMDMIGRLRDDHLELGGQATGSGLEDFLKPFLDASGLVVTPSSVGDDRSDQASFRSIGVPDLFFFTGLHDDYHQPGDVAWKINAEGAVRIVQLVRAIALASAQRREQIAFTGPKTPKVRLGVAPGDQDPAGGVTIAQVIPGSAAEEAGLKAGDRITALGGKPLPGFADLAPILAEYNPGDTIEVVYVRDGQELKASATLKARSGG